MRASTKELSVVVLMALLLPLAACAPSTTPDDISAGTWVGTITTEGNVTTVINESGSVWDGEATLVRGTPIAVSLQEQVVVPDEPSCSECEIQIERLLLLGEPQGPGMIEGENTLAARDGRGRYWVHSYDFGRVGINIFAADGSLIRQVGRQGQGPGEFLFITAVRSAPDGSVLVYDIAQGRVTRFSDAFEVLDTVRWQGIRPTFNVAPLGNGRTLVSGAFLSPDRAGLPLHLVGSEGTVFASFGPATSELTPGPEQFDLKIALGGNGDVWATPTMRYEIGRWSTEGELLETLQRRVVQPLVAEMDATAPPSAMSALQEDQQKLLWVFTTVADSRWREQITAAEDVHNTFIGLRQHYLDTVLEVIDVSTSELLARATLDEVVLPMDIGIMGGVVSLDAGGVDLRFGVWSFQLVRRER